MVDLRRMPVKEPVVRVEGLGVPYLLASFFKLQASSGAGGHHRVVPKQAI